MPIFSYSVRDANQNPITGTLEAANRGEALRWLAERFPLVVGLEQVWEGRSLWDRITGKHISSADLLAFTHQLGAMLDAGLSFGAATDIMLKDGVHHPAMRQVLVAIANSVHEGKSLSQALSEHPRYFNRLYIGMIQAGEASANLPRVLKRLSAYLDRLARMQMEVMAAIAYPATVLLFGLLLGFAMVTYGAPVVEDMYKASGAQLPWLSRMLLKAARIGAGSGFLIVGGTAATYFGLRAAGKLQGIRKWFDRACLHVGPTKELFREAITARCARTLATLYASGIPVLQALEMTQTSAGNASFAELFGRIRNQVANGVNLSDAFLREPLMPAMASGMIAAGEASGALPDLLDNCANYYEQRVDIQLRSLSRMIEPVMVVAVGLVVGLLIIALGLPFLNLVSTLS